MTTRAAGDRPLIYRGDWDAALTYNPRDIVTYDDSLWMAVSRSLGVTPTDTATEWSGFGGGASVALADTAPPGVKYSGSTVGVSTEAAHEDHTHQSIQFAYDFVIVS